MSCLQTPNHIGACAPDGPRRLCSSAHHQCDLPNIYKNLSCFRLVALPDSAPRLLCPESSPRRLRLTVPLPKPRPNYTTYSSAEPHCETALDHNSTRDRLPGSTSTPTCLLVPMAIPILRSTSLACPSSFNLSHLHPVCQ